MMLKILLILDTRNDIRNNIIEELNSIGYEVYTLPIDEKFKLSFFQKILNIIYRFVFKSNSYIDQKNKNFRDKVKEKQNQLIKKAKGFDIALIFRADVISNSELELYRSISKRMIAYQWDGIDRYTNFISKIKFFNQVYCFDPSDELLSRVKFLPNFYFKNLLSVNSTKNVYDVTYIGYYYKDRLDLLQKISDLYPHLKLNFVLKSFDREENKILSEVKFLKQTSKIYSYQEMILEHSKSKIIFDIKHEVHEGLSFRFFEAMALKKKIITTNNNVKNYDFYNSNNILIINENNLSEIQNFINIPYKEISKEILFKYSFENWFNIISDSQNKIEIENPLKQIR